MNLLLMSLASLQNFANPLPSIPASSLQYNSKHLLAVASPRALSRAAEVLRVLAVEPGAVPGEVLRTLADEALRKRSPAGEELRPLAGGPGAIALRLSKLGSSCSCASRATVSDLYSKESLLGIGCTCGLSSKATLMPGLLDLDPGRRKMLRGVEHGDSSIVKAAAGAASGTLKRDGPSGVGELQPAPTEESGVGELQVALTEEVRRLGAMLVVALAIF